MRAGLGLYYRLHGVVRELMKFGVVGGIAFVVDIGVFNLARQVFEFGPLTSKTVSVAIATTVAYAGNRNWTFRHRDRQGLGREYILFFVLNGVGLVIALACLGFTYYVLGLRSVLAENVSANVVGLALGTAFRFWSYRRWVFPELDVASEELARALRAQDLGPVTDEPPFPDPLSAGRKHPRRRRVH